MELGGGVWNANSANAREGRKRSDDNRVLGTVAGVTTAYVGNHYEYNVTAATSKRYYYAGGARVAMRDGSTLRLMLSDHLGSTAVVTDLYGARISETRFKAWGEDRYSYGTSPTTFKYTGQRAESSLGIYYYGARWYDSSLGRWLSPDSIIPAQQGVMGNDRYAYVNNSPVKYVDPTGHIACDGRDAGEGCSSSNSRFTSEELMAALNYDYGWEVRGDWSTDELDTLYNTGTAIQSYVDGVTNGKGGKWMDSYMSDVVFDHSPVVNWGLTEAGINGMVPTAQPLILLSDSGMNKQSIVHELAHTWDNSAGTGSCAATFCGGGPADGLTTFEGGTPDGLRWNNGNNGIPYDNRWLSSAHGGYGNSSSADYFAEAFGWMISDPTNLPNQSVQIWMDSVIYLEAQ